MGSEMVGALRELVALQREMQEQQARADFMVSLASFQEECPKIRKSSEAKIATKGGGQFEYTYADLETIIKTVRPILTKYGFSFTFDSEATSQLLKATCTLYHAHGHSMKASFTCPTESHSGSSAQQKFGAADTYARRRSLISVLGLSLTDDMPEPAGMGEKVTPAQAERLKKLIEETGADLTRFHKHFSVDSVDNLQATKFKSAETMLEAKRKGVKK